MPQMAYFVNREIAGSLACLSVLFLQISAPSAFSLALSRRLSNSSKGWCPSQGIQPNKAGRHYIAIPPSSSAALPSRGATSSGFLATVSLASS